MGHCAGLQLMPVINSCASARCLPPPTVGTTDNPCPVLAFAVGCADVSKGPGNSKMHAIPASCDTSHWKMVSKMNSIRMIHKSSGKIFFQKLQSSPTQLTRHIQVVRDPWPRHQARLGSRVWVFATPARRPLMLPRPARARGRGPRRGTRTKRTMMMMTALTLQTRRKNILGQNVAARPPPRQSQRRGRRVVHPLSSGRRLHTRCSRMLWTGCSA